MSQAAHKYATKILEILDDITEELMNLRSEEHTDSLTAKITNKCQELRSELDYDELVEANNYDEG